VSWLVWWFQSNSSDTSGEFHPIEVPACAEGQSLPRYEVSHAGFLIVYVLSLFLVDFVPLCFPSLSLPAAEACTDEGLQHPCSFCYDLRKLYCIFSSLNKLGCTLSS